MENIKSNLTKNLISLRKSKGLTQLELANILNYSDKAISKWERGESVPDIEILYTIANLYKVTIDQLISNEEIILSKRPNRMSNFLISLLSVLSVWIVATFTYVILSWTVKLDNLWLIFIYAIPISSIVALVFNCIWGRFYFTFLIASVILWTSVLSFYLTISFNNNSFAFFIAIPIQVAIIIALLITTTKKINK